MKSRSVLLSMFILLMSVSLAQALPQYYVNDTIGRSGNGGPFQILGYTDPSVNFQTFCVEETEYISLGGNTMAQLIRLCITPVVLTPFPLQLIPTRQSYTIISWITNRLLVMQIKRLFKMQFGRIRASLVMDHLLSLVIITTTMLPN